MSTTSASAGKRRDTDPWGAHPTVSTQEAAPKAMGAIRARGGGHTSRKLTLPDPQWNGHEGSQQPPGPLVDVVDQQRPFLPHFRTVVPFIMVRRRPWDVVHCDSTRNNEAAVVNARYQRTVRTDGQSGQLRPRI